MLLYLSQKYIILLFELVFGQKLYSCNAFHSGIDRFSSFYLIENRMIDKISVNELMIFYLPLLIRNY